MASKRGKEEGIDEIIFDILLMAPWWFGPILAALVYSLIYWGVPLIPFPDGEVDLSKVLEPIVGEVARGIAPWMAGFVLLLWVLALSQKHKSKK